VMRRAEPEKTWWTADEIATGGLPDLPASKRAVNKMVERLGWQADPVHARRRAGRGGGWEYHWRLFPSRAQASLLKAAGAVATLSARQDRGEAWAWFDGLPEAVKEQARQRLMMVQRVEALTAPMGRYLAVQSVATAETADGRPVSARTLWGWLALIDGIDPADRLPYIAPRHRAAAPKRSHAACSPEFLDRLKTDFLRLGEPSFRSCWTRAVQLAEASGWTHLTLKTAQRWMDANVPRVTQVFARQGERGLAQCFPPQIRDRSGLTALEGVNADCHQFDVFVRWPGIDLPVRPEVVAFQDLYSGKILAWRLDLTPNKVSVMSAFGELIETWGIPKHCLFDNGHEFANKWLTGGAKSRFRFTIRDDDPLGVLPMMGITVHWATPGHGQAKPVERGFRDFAEHISKHPAFAGAYVGRNPLAKPEDYGSRAIPLADFLKVIDRGIADHNARDGRLSETARGRSFDETFAASYEATPIRKATEEQRRLWMMGQEVRRLHSKHGGLTLFRNGYWSDWMSEFAGKRVVARFDPENLHAGVYLYTLQGEFLGQAACREKVGFFDVASAKAHARWQSQVKGAERKLLNALRTVPVDQYARELAEMPRPEPEPLEAKVVAMVPPRASARQIERRVPVPDTSRDEELRQVLQVDFAPKPTEPQPETEAARFWRVLDIEKRSKAGAPVTDEEFAFWQRMQAHPVYRAQRAMYDRDGDVAIG